MKRVILLAAVILVGFQSAAWAQEREPLAMRIEFEWTVIGVVGGAAFGALIWLTDPANPNTNLSDNVTIGAAWGTIIGMGIGVFILQRSAVFPQNFAYRSDPLAPRNRITSDPIATLQDGGDLFARGALQGGGGDGITLPLLNIRF